MADGGTDLVHRFEPSTQILLASLQSRKHCDEAKVTVANWRKTPRWITE
jgi:hypothetical protein